MKIDREVKRTERGWAGHFICADRCLFRRNTLLESGDIKIVVSTVGLMVDEMSDKRKFITIGLERHYETMAFHSKVDDTRYHDADVSRQVYFDSEWAIQEIGADDKANDMHEAVVAEITRKLASGDDLEGGRMKTDRELLQQALEALDSPEMKDEFEQRMKLRKIADAIKERLAQPEQEPVGYVHKCASYDDSIIKTDINAYGAMSVAVFTTPPARPWQSLTDEDIVQGQKESWVEKQAFESACWWADAKLKEKNT